MSAAKQTNAQTGVSSLSNEPPKLVEPKSDFSELELALEMKTPCARDRASQTVRVFRIEDGIRLMEHPAGVEVTGPNARWRGIVPWSSIKVAKR